ncbi:inhibitor of Bruton tyrosine kinase isoform X4 [Ursus americanus]|uniref:Inhibitor of Bruton tyrosine kinase n=1 Tax=Ursus maritimus TaxID=29073 RepID=A0A8M1GXS4_URSMA|nr:inhibitor of Bruton tyrosine kinase isoform X4 [Ursus arctos]XP_040499632.1 inhibitor of Bruton tyrosine kinase isoform X2 [Ursus maritimus]XP_045660242.1 inhibitor of Bruton tyrosine kinase isoform X4 [Ursus americanus]
MNSSIPDCTSKCRSLKHALDVLSVVTKGNENQIKAFLSSHCYNAATIKDAFGRNALHLVSSCGKKGVLDWLIEKGVDLLVKDKESGWTALHRSIFYGHIDCVWSLLKHGVSLYIQDKEGLSALDLVMKDRPTHVVFKTTDPTDVYTWGDNTNFTLGHGSQNSKHHPELVDLFSRSGVYIKQVVLCKFHSVFLSQKGQVYTCGHGPGGRLGHGDEQTCLIPRLVEGLSGHNCSQVAAAKDHTVVLTEDGCVYTFGLNIFHQLGIIPPPASCNVPRQMQAKYLKGRTVIGVAAGRFHTVLWTREAVYTMGLNGGQLGYLPDPNGEKYVTAPRQVSALHHKDITLSLVAASDGATVCVTTRGDIYLLADYQCKKMASRQLNLKKVLVSGGRMEYKVDPENLKENGGQKICILAMDGAGRVFCWRSVSSSLKQCRWAYPRQVFISDIALNRKDILFVTQDGEGFRGKWFEEKKKNSEKKEILSNLHNSSSDVSCVSDINSVYERIRLEKLTFAHRAVSVSTDPSGCNFAILQSDPKTSLYEIPSVSSSSFFEEFGKLLRETDETDSIHDVTFQVGNRIFPAHKYILAAHSDFFQKLFLSDGTSFDFTDVYRKDEDSAGCHLFVVEKVHPDLFEYLLQFIYTDTCDFLIHGFTPRINLNKKPEEYQGTMNSRSNKMNCHEDNQKSAFEVYRSNQAHTVNEKQKSKPKSSNKGKSNGEDDPVRMLQNVAKKFGFSNLSSRLDGVKFENGKINVIEKKTGNKSKLNQKKCSFLCDVTMKSMDGKEFPCHKCVLCARLEYFHSMLSSSWIEASTCTALEMPIHSDILKVILDYLYTDEAVVIKESQNVDFVCSVLVVADQLLITRLKGICEVALTEKLTLKNAAMVLEFAAMYNAEQLKLSCLQFIGLNMAALLEARSLDVLSDGVLKDLSVFYRKMIPAMDRRVITPYQDGPDISYLEVEDGDIFLKEEINLEQNFSESMFKKAKTKAKKKPRKRSDSSGGYNLSDVIQSPPSTGLLKSDKTNSVESLPELLTSDSSEGSYAGVGSPRDLQSPDFIAGFQSDKIEGKIKPYVNGTPPTYSREDLKPWEKSPILNISAPQTIPSNRIDTTSSSSWVAGSFSPVSPPVMDLRTIMQIEESRQKCGATPKTNLGKMISHGVKLSQKQRKMIAMTTKENNSGTNSMETALTAPSKTPKPVNAWASSSLYSVSSKSFRDFLEEKKSVTGHSSGDHVKKVCFKGIENSQAPKIARCSTHGTPGPEGNHISDLSLLDSHNPWLSSSLTAPSTVAPVTFASIVEEELQQEAALIRSREKPLALIQIEERAIQDLLVFYEAFGNPDEFVIVERTPQGPLAVPMWNKHGC